MLVDQIIQQLSRVTIDSVLTNIPFGIYFKKLAEAQANDLELSELVESPTQHSLVLQ